MTNKRAKGLETGVILKRLVSIPYLGAEEGSTFVLLFLIREAKILLEKAKKAPQVSYFENEWHLGVILFLPFYLLILCFMLMHQLLRPK